MVLRNCRPTNSAKSNTEPMDVKGVSWSLACCLTLLITCCVVAKLPLLSMTNTPSPGVSNTVILQKVETWSTPAFVRESEANTRPSFKTMATQ